MLQNRLTVAAFINSKDLATANPNENGMSQMTRSVEVPKTQTTDVLQLTKNIGEDIRIELTLQAQTLFNDDIRVDGVIRIYEGISTFVAELNNEIIFTSLVPLHRLVTQNIDVHKAGADKESANITVSLNNNPSMVASVQSQMIQRCLKAAVSLYAVSHENFEIQTDKVVYLSRSIVVTDENVTKVIQVRELLTAEIEVSLLLTALVLPNGDIRLDGDARFFTAGNNSIQQFEGQRILTATVPRGQHTSRVVTLERELGEQNQVGSDLAMITFNFRNQSV